MELLKLRVLVWVIFLEDLSLMAVTRSALNSHDSVGSTP